MGWNSWYSFADFPNKYVSLQLSHECGYRVRNDSWRSDMEKQAAHTRYMVSIYRGSGNQCPQYGSSFFRVDRKYGIVSRAGVLYDDDVDFAFYPVFF